MARRFTPKVRVSLANKCQLLFGAAVVLILIAALLVVSLRMSSLVARQPQKRAQDFAKAWLDDRIQLGGAVIPVDRSVEPLEPGVDITLSLIEREDFDRLATKDEFLARSIERFRKDEQASDLFTKAEDEQGELYFRYARAVRQSDASRLLAGMDFGPGLSPALETTLLGDPVEMVLLIQLRDESAAREQLINRIYLVAAGVTAGLLAVTTFWFITTRLILSPVRVLQSYAEKIASGDVNIRSDINTGDEFESLSDMFNHMLDALKDQQDQLKAANKTLDLRLGELAESNVALYEANKVKGDFLANVSHELRTPLNSIIGFAEVLEETLQSTPPALEAGFQESSRPIQDSDKLRRYSSNIIISARRLLDLINDLLDLAKIEAGKMEPRIEPVSVVDLCEALMTLIRPQAESRSISLRLKLEQGLPLVSTDAGKLQQIVFNFLSNAVKFTPDRGSVTVSASRMPVGGESEVERIRISVSDTGLGIASEDQDRIFEKFVQLDASVTREHGGTGLGLTISQELAEMLQGHISVSSAPERGATFSMTLPVSYQDEAEPLMPGV